MSASGRTRALFVCCLFATVFTVFSARLVDLQVARHGEYAAKAAENHVTKEPIHAGRGVIEDVNGQPLAQNEPVKTVLANGSLIEKRDAVARILAECLELDERQVLARLSTQRFSKTEKKEVPSLYIVVKRKVSEEITNKITARLEAAKLSRGIWFEPDSVRSYPNGSLLCHVVGFVSSENEGVEGVERTMNDYLRGHDGFRYVERDRTGRELVPYRGQERPPRDGLKVRLTIDLGLQQIVEQELDAAIRQFRPKMAIVILMRPTTGEILALANRPHFDPNELEAGTEDRRRNRAITDMVEPGSTFKIVTTAAALHEKLVRPDTVIFCENGYFRRYKLKDHHGYGDLTVREILAKSSNVGLAKLGEQLGEQKLYEYAKLFGFGDRTSVQLPGESAGKVHPPHTWSKISISRLPMGHEIGATPLQVVGAMAAIANGGKLMVPQIVREVVDADGVAVARYGPQVVRRVASEQAIAAVQEALLLVVSQKGTARLAAISGYKVAGKTGTAQKFDENGRYVRDRHLVSFVGYLPAEAPEFVGLVMLDEPQTNARQDTGGWVAAPVFSRIGERAARYLNLVPAPEPPPGQVIVTQRERSAR